jgi:hypothetical protein
MSLAAVAPAPSGEAFSCWQAGLRKLRRLMIAGGRLPGRRSCPVRGHQRDEVLPVLSGQTRFAAEVGQVPGV